jgi:hypothetical protein
MRFAIPGGRNFLGISPPQGTHHLPKISSQDSLWFGRSINRKLEVVSRFLGCADSLVVDRPRGHRGSFARCLTARLFFVFVRVLERLSFDHFCRWIFGA